MHVSSVQKYKQYILMKLSYMFYLQYYFVASIFIACTCKNNTTKHANTSTERKLE